MCVGAAHMHRTGTHGEARAGLLADHEHDPLAVRLALMSFPSEQPADLTASVLTGARDTVGDWQRRVARWAEQPSRPVPPNLAETVRAAFGDLDIPSAIALLRGLADDDSVPPGAKFEAFLYVHRVLGLDLPRQIGKLS
jgi:cysteinyl-tRNA synthetase